MKKKRLRTIGSKMTALFLLCALLLSAALSVYSYFSSWQEYTEFFSHKAEEMVAIVAANVDGDKIANYLKTGKTDAYYEELGRFLASIKREAGIEYLYLFQPGDTELTYILEAALETDDINYINKMNDVYPYTELEYKYLVPDVQAKRASQEKIISPDSGYGPGVSAWAPVLTSTGELAAMVEADYSLKSVTDMLKANVLNSLLMSLTLIATMILALALFTRKIVSRPLGLLTRHTLNFVNANSLAFPADIHTGDEMQTLSEAFGQMTQDIAQYTKHVEAVAADKERITAELDLATGIRISLLPQTYPAFPERDEFDVCARLQPAKIVGGDFYDYFLIDARRLCFAAGSVSGKGISAALFMVVAKTIIKNQMMAGLPVSEAMGLINARLFESSTASMAVSAFVGVLDISTGQLLYVNAGGPAPMMTRGGGYETLSGQEMPKLAEVESVVYRAMEIQLRQGDRLLLLTDGAVNARNSRGQTFGRERLRALLEEGRVKAVGLPAALQKACDGIAVFEEGQEREMDVTLLMLEYRKGDRALAEITVRAREDAFAAVQRFLKRQLSENGIAGPAYAPLGMAAEEAFILVAQGASGRGEITVRCAVEDAPNIRIVTISLLYAGAQADPLQADSDADSDATDFIRRSMDEVRYAYSDGKNIVTLIKRFFA